MSKMDNLRALRETRYARGAAPATKGAAAPNGSTPPAIRADHPVVETGDEGLCGHHAISGRTCTRERGHAAKSHRYS